MCELLCPWTHSSQTQGLLSLLTIIADGCKTAPSMDFCWGWAWEQLQTYLGCCLATSSPSLLCLEPFPEKKCDCELSSSFYVMLGLEWPLRLEHRDATFSRYRNQAEEGYQYKEEREPWGFLAEEQYLPRKRRNCDAKGRQDKTPLRVSVARNHGCFSFYWSLFSFFINF